jgi:hypothetical protein
LLGEVSGRGGRRGCAKGLMANQGKTQQMTLKFLSS